MKDLIPNFLYDKLVNDYGLQDTEKILTGYSFNRPVTLRINTTKTTKEEIKKKLIDLDISFKEVKWYKEAFIVENVKEKFIKNLDIYKNGDIYLQSLSSMMPPLVINPQKGESILDMAASPGGKTTQMSNLSNGEALIMACEKNKIRAERLKYNISKQGSKKVSVVVKDARNLDEFFTFDKILLDAPCSGSGTININSEIVINEDLVNRSVKFQKELLESALKHLKQGGEIVYSTCSILKDENEKVLEFIKHKYDIEIIPINDKIFENIPLLPVDIIGTICVCPSELYEGFFIAKIRKK